MIENNYRFRIILVNIEIWLEDHICIPVVLLRSPSISFAKDRAWSPRLESTSKNGAEVRHQVNRRSQKRTYRKYYCNLGSICSVVVPGDELLHVDILQPFQATGTTDHP